MLLFLLVTGPRRSLSLKLSDTRVYEPQTPALLGTIAHFQWLHLGFGESSGVWGVALGLEFNR